MGNSREYTREYSKQRRKRLRAAVFALLGNCCSNPDCRHLNEDDTLGCRDVRLLQIDHINGGGTKEIQKMHRCATTFYTKILRDEGKGYRILCAQCNWLHRYEEF